MEQTITVVSADAPAIAAAWLASVRETPDRGPGGVDVTFREWLDSYHGSKWWHGETGYTEEDMLAAWEAGRQAARETEPPDEDVTE